MRTLLSTALTLALASVLLAGGGARAQDSRLPDIGSSAGEVLGPAHGNIEGQFTVASSTAR